MDIVLGIVLVLLLVAVTAATIAVLVALWRGLGAELRRVRSERRRAAFLGGLGALLYVVAGSVLLVAAPWGRSTWLVLFGTVAVLLVVLTAVLVVRGPRADG